MKDGYVFVNEEGNYALEIQNTGFGSARTCIAWTSNINDATVFHSTTPWTGCMSRHLAAPLKRAQALKASAARVVKLNAWGDE